MSAIANSITSRTLGLAVTGMQASLGTLGGLDDFQSWIYYAPPLQVNTSQEIAISSDQYLEGCLAALRDGGLDTIGRLEVVYFADGLQPDEYALQTGLTGFAGSVGIQTEHGKSLGKTLSYVQDLLDSDGADAVLLCTAANGPIPGLAVVLIETAARASDRQAVPYSLVESAAWTSGYAGTPDETLRAVSAQAMHLGLALPPTIGLVEVTGENTFSLPGLAEAYRPGGGDLTCALAALPVSGLPALFSLVKVCLCISRWVIPAINSEDISQISSGCEDSPFYLPGQSRTWFKRRYDPPRSAGLAILDDSPEHLIFREVGLPRKETPDPIAGTGLHLFLLSASSPEDLDDQLNHLLAESDAGNALAGLSRETCLRTGSSQGRFTLSLLARDPAELAREIGFAAKGFRKSIETGSEWQTPAGSYFTARPLGREGHVTFVYPGAFNSYTGVGKDIFYLYPRVFKHLTALSANVGGVLRERLLYPRSRCLLSQAEVDALDAQMAEDAVTMLSSGSTLSVMYTLVLQEYFNVRPGSAFGYSLGETSMMFAFQVWANGDVSETVLNNSPLFKSRLAGPRDAVREYWGLPPAEDAFGSGHEGAGEENIWANYVIMADPQVVQAAIHPNERVFLTHVNTPRQVVIGGDPSACQRVIDSLKAPSLRAPFDHVLHCAAMAGEYDTLVELNTWPVFKSPAVPLYSAARYAPLEMDVHTVARSLGAMLCAPLDFPRLIGQAYDGGARLFVELGAGSNCARWIGETLKDKPHAAFSMDRKGLDDGSAILRAVARLASHEVPLDLGCLFPPLSISSTARIEHG